MLFGLSATGADYFYEQLDPVVKCQPAKLIIKNGEFLFPACKPKKRTYFAGRIIWGESSGFHETNSSLFHTAVRTKAVDDSWEYRGVTASDGKFMIEVKPNSNFRFAASSGSYWAEYNETIIGIPAGTIQEDTKILQP